METVRSAEASTRVSRSRFRVVSPRTGKGIVLLSQSVRTVVGNSPETSEGSCCGRRDTRIYSCTPSGLLDVRVSAPRRPPVHAACISRHLDSIATKSSLASGQSGQADVRWRKGEGRAVARNRPSSGARIRSTCNAEGMIQEIHFPASGFRREIERSRIKPRPGTSRGPAPKGPPGTERPIPLRRGPIPTEYGLRPARASRPPGRRGSRGPNPRSQGTPTG